MTYFLYIWIGACYGLDCPIPTVTIKEFDDLQACEAALDVTKTVHDKTTKKRFKGICLPEDAHQRIQQHWGQDE